MSQSPSDELAYLKSLVEQLNDKIKQIESRGKAPAAKERTPAEQLRMILVGPPGAGTFYIPPVRKEKNLKN